MTGRPRKFFPVAALALLALANAGSAVAEKADRQQVLRMSARQGSAEGTKESNLKKLEGDVLVTQGTMKITAERAVVKESPDGVFAELFGSPGNPVTFRQRRDGESDYVEGSAERAEYDDKTGSIRLYSKVKFRSAGDVIDSEYMQYNTNTEKMELLGQVPGAKPRSGGGDGRIVFEIQPRAAPDSKAGRGKGN